VKEKKEIIGFDKLKEIPELLLDEKKE
jgi:hypothetical protein